MSELESTSNIPSARVVQSSEAATRRWRTKLWGLTAVCAVLAIGLVISSFRSQGTLIHIHFDEGYGLKAGDTLHYRGIDVGKVTQVVLDRQMQGVDVTVQLISGNEQLAVEDSQFWIQRPRLRIGQISGLETVLGAKYLGVLPGPQGGPAQREFVGIETPLGMAENDAAEIRVSFPAGEGLEVGDSVRYRGMSVGEITDVQLSESGEGVWVGVRLVGFAKRFAQEGTQFWIERPRVEMTEIRGLETLLGGRYLAMQPTQGSAPMQTEFIGLAEPPPLPRRDGSLEIELDAANRAGLVRGAPITYRGLEVGRVANVGLSSDGATVKIQVVIDAEYAELVRENSKWWTISGVEFDVGLKGIQVSMDSFSSWLRGGIAFATPNSPGKRVATGYRYTLAEAPQPEWLEWQPRIAVNNSGNKNGRSVPQTVRVAASWQTSFLGIQRRQSEQTWGIVLDDNTLNVPTNFVKAAQEAGHDVQIEIAGRSFLFNSSQVESTGLIAAIPLPSETPVEMWPVSKVTPDWAGQEVLLVNNPELSEPLAIDVSRIMRRDSTMLELAPAIAISETLEGSVVVDGATGDVVGLLTRVSNSWRVATIAK